MAPILVTPSTTWATSWPNSSRIRSIGGQGVLDDVVQQAGGDGHDVQLHVGEEIGDLERVDEVGLARVADLSLVLEGREDVGPPEQLDVGVGAVAPDFFDEVLEPNHGWRCLTSERGEISRTAASGRSGVDVVFFGSLY